MASGRRKKTVIDSPCGTINDLPGNVIETILMCLPLRDAVRTSILSRKWRNNWVRIPNLVFDDTFCLGLEKNQPYCKIKLMMTIYHVLLLHRGPIRNFTLSVSELESCSEIDLLTQFLSRKNVEEITLRLRGCSNPHERYKLPSSLFSCQKLRRLNLFSCVFKLPHVFKGFSRLTSLYLTEVDFDADLFGNFISSCPLLEKVFLVTENSFDCLEIDAPKLKLLCFTTSFNSIHFKNAPLLEVLSITSAGTNHLEQLKEGETFKVIEVFGSLPVIESLYLGYRFMKVFASATAAEGPVLELLGVQDYSDFTLNQLREVRISLFCGSRPELEFIKLILANSPMLEKMHIEPISQETGKGFRMLKELIRFGRASTKAEIIYKDSAGDQV